MVAGDSAARRSHELKQESQFLLELANAKEQEAKSFAAACDSERDLAVVLGNLKHLGWHVLEDRLWPGSKRANIDFLLIGPGGVVVVDAKTWAEVAIIDGVLYRGDVREDDEIDKLQKLERTLADALAPTGLTSAAISTVLAFTNKDIPLCNVGPISVLGANHLVRHLVGLRQRMSPDQVKEISTLAGQVCCEQPSDTAPTLFSRRRPQARRQPTEADEPLVEVDDIVQPMIDAAMAGPIEDWMTFLHPDQNKLVRTNWDGPARIRGPAGTGKTVVGLHRAVYLAERSEKPVLMTSFVRTLPRVMEALATKMSPRGAENIRFIGVHALASRALEIAGKPARVDRELSDKAFQEAWRKYANSNALTQVDERPSYWKEEIDYVIKGRGLLEFDAYRDLQRVGRRTQLRKELREPAWDLYLAYEELLVERGVHDFNDLLLQAREVAIAFPELFPFSSVIVDEVQDLNLAAFRFLASLAKDGPNSLLIIGDGQQSVYPGGFTLSEAGINVTGRASVLRVNYRNTIEILDKASSVIASDAFHDLDGPPVSGTRDTEATRHGYAPIVATAETRTSLDPALTSQIARTRDALGVPWGDMAVLVQSLKDVEHFQRVLRDACIPSIELSKYDGTSTDKVKLGTFKRAKGLDFKFVLMPGLSEYPPDFWKGEAPDAYAERAERQRREIFVGMTRARDGLWLGYLRPAMPRF